MNPYNTIEQKGVQIERMFNSIAPVYDNLCHVLSFNVDKYWRYKMARLVAKNNPKSIIDLATGTADLAINISSQVENADIVGIDISNNMLDIGRKKVHKLNLDTRIRLMQSNAENLPFDKNQFDAVTIAFGIRNFQKMEQCLSECYRVLKTDGALYIMEFSTPRNKLFRLLYKTYSNVIPLIGKSISRDRYAYQYLTDSIKEFPSKDEFIKKMLSVGFENCQSYSLFNGIAYIYTGIKSKKN